MDVALTAVERKRFEADMVLVGTYMPSRARLIKALDKVQIKVKVYGPYWKYFERGPHIHDGIYGPEMVKVFNRARIVLNIHMDEDLAYKVNMRTFEATGSGAFLLTDKAYGIERMFDVGKELALYEDDRELVKLANHYLASNEERMQISGNAQRKAHEGHTYRRRLQYLLGKIQNGHYS